MLGSTIQSHSDAKVFKYSTKCGKTDITQAIGISRRFTPSGIGSWRRRGNSGRIAASGRRERKRFAITYPLDTYPLERYLVLIWHFFYY
jgi:hypothetical protein